MHPFVKMLQQLSGHLKAQPSQEPGPEQVPGQRQHPRPDEAMIRRVLGNLEKLAARPCECTNVEDRVACAIGNLSITHQIATIRWVLGENAVMDQKLCDLNFAMAGKEK